MFCFSSISSDQASMRTGGGVVMPAPYEVIQMLHVLVLLIELKALVPMTVLILYVGDCAAQSSFVLVFVQSENLR